MSHTSLAVSINAQSPEQLRGMDIFDRYNALMDLGMFADEHMIGHPERHVSQWKPDELQAVINIFETWPQEEGFEQKLDAFKSKTMELYIQTLQQTSGLDRKAKLQIAAECFSQSCRETLGFDDFPDIELVFAPGISPGYYGGLRPDGKIQICSRNLLRDTVEGSSFSGDLSFVELVFHEATHKLQSYMADKSDKSNPDEYMNMLVAQNFYESTAELKKLNRDIYLKHPFEYQARSTASDLCSQIGKQLIGRSFGG